jgi:hypothetical protein
VLAHFQDRENDNSPPLGNARTVPMRPLPPEAVQELVDALPPDRRVERSDVMSLTGGNAWLTSALLRELQTGKAMSEAARAVYDTSTRVFETWEQQLSEEARRLLIGIPVVGRPPSDVRDLQHRLEMEAITVGVLFSEDAGRMRVPRLFRDWLRDRDPIGHVWDVAISYAPHDEDESRELAGKLDEFYDVFFAPSQNIQLVQTDPMDNPPGLYRTRARCVVVYFSSTYERRYWRREWGRRSRLLRFDPSGGARRNGAKRLGPDSDGSLQSLRRAIDLILQDGR